ncbi:MAG TPA: hypothetical protein VEK07_15825 [Polyangiaceae bacterium]|nr:hypothetical protein [Polyangiaceae bacterium]
MSEAAVRQRFDGASSGTWSSQVSSDQTTLRWGRTVDRPALPRAVVFEFTAGKLAAIRADLESSQALALGPPLEASFAAVVARQPEADGSVRLTVLSRTCSGHVAEAARLIASDARNPMFTPIANRP